MKIHSFDVLNNKYCIFRGGRGYLFLLFTGHLKCDKQKLLKEVFMNNSNFHLLTSDAELCFILRHVVTLACGHYQNEMLVSGSYKHSDLVTAGH